VTEPREPSATNARDRSAVTVMAILDSIPIALDVSLVRRADTIVIDVLKVLLFDCKREISA